MMSCPELMDCHLGFIGAGNMAMALVQGFLNSGQIKAKNISVSAPTNLNLNKFKDLGCFTTNKNNELFDQFPDNNCLKVLFVCVKPNIFKSGLNLDLRRSMITNPLIISVMAGITLNQLREQFDQKVAHGSVKYARLIPNTAATVGAAVCGLSIEDPNDKLLEELLIKMLTPIGLCEFVAEDQMNALTGLGGSGIAFVYSLIHAMSDGGLKMGLSRSVSNNVAAQTVLGAALMVLKTGKNPIVLRDEVTSPGGTTIHGLHALEKGAFNAVVIDAIEAATKRTNQLS